MASSSLRAGDIVRIRNERWVVTRQLHGSTGTQLDVRGHDRGNADVRTSFLLPCEPFDRLPQSDAPRIVMPRTWVRHARAALAEAIPSPLALRIRPGPSLSILPFQLEPALVVTRGVATRILIADEVGLGKTIQAGLVVSEVLSRRPDAHVLIVAPAGLREQWHDELQLRLGLDPRVLDSAALARYGGIPGRNPWAVHPIVITSLDYIKRPEVLRSLEPLIWDVIVFDEAHALVGRSDRAAAAAAMAERARTVLLLTATPHSGDDEAFSRLCAIGDLRERFPLVVFRRTRSDVGLTTSRKEVSLRIRPTTAEMDMHHAIASYTRLIWAQRGRDSSGVRLVASVLCRRACSSASSLARSLERRLSLLTSTSRPLEAQPRLPFDDGAVDDEEPDALLSLQGLDDSGEERRLLERLVAFAQRVGEGESKLDALARLLRRSRQPAIVFTEYRDTLATLAIRFSNYSPILLHGGLTTAERHDSTRRFNHGGHSLLLATDAASEGLNLHHHCRLVINLELPWTPVRFEQRIGRVERIGQGRRVHAIHLLATGTSEEHSVARLLLRSARVEHALSDMRPGGTEDLLEAIISGRDASPPARSASLPANVIRGDLKRVALEEAARLETVRRLAASAAALRADLRPFVTVWTRRRHLPAYWIFSLAFLDGDQQHAWDTVVGVSGIGTIPSRARDSLRAWLHLSSGSIRRVVEDVHARVLADVSASVRAPLELASAREDSIKDALASRRARLSASLLQGSLFDRRSERAAAAQTAVIDEALGRCEARLLEIGSAQHLDRATATLRFVLLRR